MALRASRRHVPLEPAAEQETADGAGLLAAVSRRFEHRTRTVIPHDAPRRYALLLLRHYEPSQWP